ncbi:MAG: PKD domain-containing protein [Bacteroidia bacterium]
MKNFQYTKLLFAFLGMMLFGLQGSQASHQAGLDMTFECVGPCTYRLIHKAYYDCCGGATSGSLPIPNNGVPNAVGAVTWTGIPVGCSPLPTISLNWAIAPGGVVDVTPTCASVLTTCNYNFNQAPPGTICGILEGTQIAEYNVCGTGGSIPCTAYRFGWGSCCRNGAITSGATGGLGTNNTLIDLSVTPCNNSPTFLEPPISFICLPGPGQIQTYNQGAVDPDGDSLAYRLVTCKTGPPNNTSVNYNAAGGFTFQQPLGSDWVVTMDPFTGDVTFDPQPGSLQVGVICFEVLEYRNGVLIGTVTRDMQVQVINQNCGTPPQVTANNYTLGGVPINPLTVSVVSACIGAELCFDIPLTNPDTLDYTMNWVNRGLVGATLTNAANGVPAPFISTGKNGNIPTARFCWIPTGPGIYFFTLRVEDDQCPLNGVQDQTFTIRVNEVLNRTTATAIALANCNEVELCAQPVSTIPSPFANRFTYSWSGNGNLDTNNVRIRPFLDDSCFIHRYPSPGAYFYDVLVTDTFGCSYNYRGFLTALGQVTANAGPDLTICSGFQYTIGTPSLPNHAYSWSPSTFLSDPNIAQPTFQQPASTTSDTFDYEVTATDINDPGCQVVDFVRVVVNANLSVTVLPTNPRICRGDTLTLTASGGTTYQWSNQPAPGSNTIRFAPRSSTVVSVAAYEKGCTSPPTFVNVTVDPGPQGFITGDTRICRGDNTILVGSGGDNYRWSDPAAVGNLLTLTNVTTPRDIWMIPIDQGCEGDTVFARIESYAVPVANFGFERVCAGAPTMFTDSSTTSEDVIVSWSWDFGDAASGANNTSNQEDPTHTFSAPGTYTVTLEIGTNNGCSNIITRQVTVDAIPEADFTFQNVCEGLPHSFSNTSTISIGNISQYTWSFGDGNSSTSNNATHQYTDPTFYNVTLVAETPNGCVDSITQTVLYHPNPIASFAVVNACQDSVVFAFDGAAVGGGLDEVNQWFWDFGDPSSPNNNSVWDNPRHVYENAGQAVIQLTVTTANGCSDDTTAEVTIHETPVADFEVTGNCENSPVLYTQTATSNPATPLVRWDWDFGQGDKADTRSATVSYREVGSGIYPVRLEVITSEGCRKTLIRDVIINPSPQVRFSYQDVCIGEEMSFRSKTEIDSSASLPGALAAWNWNFGGAGQGFTSGPAVGYTYNEPGIYNVRLSVTSDSGCVSFNDREVEVYALPAIPDLTAETVCFSNSARLLAAAPQSVTVNWYETATATEPFHTGYSYVTPPLPFTTTYYVEPVSPEGCINTRQPITASVFDEAQVLLNTSRTQVDLPLGVVEFDATSSVPLVEWNWDFGEGTTSTLAEPVHEYREPGRYEVTLVVTDERGCTYTRGAVIEVTKTIGDFFPSAFTPNGDGFNDTYEIGGYNLIDFQIIVYNRWGREVFKANNVDFAWNGRDASDAEVPEGVYVYVARFLDTNGKMTEKKGTITLIR